MKNKRPGYIQFPVEEQLSRLGLHERLLELSVGGRFLDVGCGVDANLVRYLKGRGINAEGIDPALREANEYLMRLSVKARAPNPGCIPRPDNYYDVVVSHGNGTLRILTDYYETDIRQVDMEIDSQGSGDLEGRVIMEQIKQHLISEVYEQAICSLSEMFRVVKPGGVVICHPGITRLENRGDLVIPKNLVMYQRNSTIKDALLILLDRQRYDEITRFLEEMNPRLIRSKFWTTVFTAHSIQEDSETPEQFMERFKEELRRRNIPIPEYDPRRYETYVREHLTPMMKSSLELHAMEEPTKEPRQYTGSKEKTGRNDRCPCGSGKKFKHCCVNKQQ